MKSLAVGWLTLLGLYAAIGSDVAEVGDSPTHTFKSPIVNGMGTKDLGALRGRPVLVEFWGTY